jgi:hypothetical protein
MNCVELLLRAGLYILWSYMYIIGPVAIVQLLCAHKHD